jgi:hypothetical protein
MFEKVRLDVVHTLASSAKHCLVLAQDDLSGYVEGRDLANATSQTIARFLWEDIDCRHGCFGRLVIDGRPEN